MGLQIRNRKPALSPHNKLTRKQASWAHICHFAAKSGIDNASVVLERMVRTFGNSFNLFYFLLQSLHVFLPPFLCFLGPKLRCFRLLLFSLEQLIGLLKFLPANLSCLLWRDVDNAGCLNLRDLPYLRSLHLHDFLLN